MNITEPTRSTRAWLRASANVERQLRVFIKSTGCTTKAKREAAIARASVRKERQHD